MTGLTATAARTLLAAAIVAVVLAGPATASATWNPGLLAGSHAEAQSRLGPPAPTGVSAVCGTTKGTVTVTWTAVANATTYTLYDSTTSAIGTYSSYATGIITTSYTTGVLTSNKNYWFEVVAYIGTKWVSVKSAATSQRTISSTGNCS